MKRLFLLLLIILTVKQTEAQELQTVVQRGHNASVKAVAFTKDGKYLLTGSRDKTIKLWDIASGREIRTFFGHESTINDLALSPDGTQFLSSSADKTARLWEIATGKLLQTFKGHEDLLTAVDFNPNGKQVITAGYDNEAILWDIKSGEKLKTFRVNPDKGIGYGVNVAFHPDGNTVVFGNDNRSAMLYNVATGDTLQEIKPAKGWCGGCATFVDFSNDGKKLLKGSKGHSLELLDAATGEVEKTFVKKWDEFTSVDLSSNGSVLMTGEDTLKVFSQNGKLLFNNFRLHSMPITDAVFSPDGKIIATASDDQSVKLINAKTGELVKTIEGYLKQADKGGLDYDPNSRWEYYIKKYTDLKNDVEISPDGKYLVKGKIGSTARMWEIQTGVIKQEFRGHSKAVLCMNFSDDGKRLLTGSADNTIKLWDVATGQELATFKGHRELVFSVRFSKDQNKVISGSWDGTVRIWDAKTYEQVDYLRLENGSSYETRFYRGDIYAVTAGLDKTLKLWELDSKQEVRNFQGHTDIIHSIDLHPRGKNLASASWDGLVKVWDISSGLQESRLNIHKGAVYALKYNHNGSVLATGGTDRSIKLTNTIDGSVEKTLQGHTGSVTSIRFTPDDKLLVSASDNGEVKIWDVESGEELVSYLILNETDWMAINSEGYFNATDGATRSITFVKGMESYSADQFFDQFYQPDLLNKTFNAGDRHLNINEKIEKYPPPKVEILAPHQSETVRKAQIDVLAKATDSGGGISRVKVVHNGKTVLLKDAQSKNSRAAINQTVTLVPGDNQVSVSAFSDGGIESSSETVNIKMEGKVNSTLYLFSVGINKYRNEALNLNYASADAESFSKLINSRSKKLFDRVETISLYDYEATKDNILVKLSALSKVIKPQDVLVFYYAGHGSMVDNEFYFIPTENTRLYSEDKLNKNAINANELQQKLKGIAALKQLLIIDACQSGGSVELLATRGAGEEKALAQLSRSAGIHVLAAAGSEQFAVEFKELGHGLFTYVVLEALSGAADGAPKDGKVTIYELKSFIDDQVPEYSRKYKGKMQFPYTFSRGQDFPVVID